MAGDGVPPTPVSILHFAGEMCELHTRLTDPACSKTFISIIIINLSFIIIIAH